MWQNLNSFEGFPNVKAFTRKQLVTRDIFLMFDEPDL